MNKSIDVNDDVNFNLYDTHYHSYVSLRYISFVRAACQGTEVI